MKTATIAVIILSLILPAGTLCLSEESSNSHSAQMESNGRLLAIKDADKDFRKNQPGNSAIRWYKRTKSARLNGVALVIHGLNGRPDKMESIIAAMTAAGIDCLNLSLRGHGENYSQLDNIDSAEARMASFKSVSYRLWRAEIYQAYQQAKIKSNRYRTCVFLVGFSTGGLLGVDLLTSNPYIKFDKMVLFAPALKMRNRNYLLKTISPFPGLVVPSFGPDDYLANKGTPVAAYNALFEASKHFEKNLDHKINIPAVIFIDKQDELISFSGLKAMIEKQKLDQWKLHPVKKDERTAEIEMHHIIIDEASVGKKMWKEIVDTTITHLRNGSAACEPAR
ncbi:MAG: alpha/beta hydrolase [Desulfobacterales bacterium]|jgi:alpha-beta hydrolase superfamily lysophospholipase